MDDADTQEQESSKCVCCPLCFSAQMAAQHGIEKETQPMTGEVVRDR